MSKAISSPSAAAGLAGEHEGTIAVRRLTKVQATYWGIFFLCLCYYFGVGAFPVSPPFKADSTSMASGALQIMEHGWDGPRLDYGRETRPGIFLALIALRWLSGADTYLLFSLLSLVTGVVFVVVMALFVARYVPLPAPVCGIVIILLFPDSVAWACYPNGSAVAAGLGMSALYLLARSERPAAVTMIVAGVLAGAATLARLDAVLLGPVAVFLLYATSGRRATGKLAIFAAVAIAVVAAGLWTSGGNVANVIRQTHSVVSNPWPSEPKASLFMRVVTDYTFRACLAFFPLLTVFLILLGTYRLFQRRQWKVLGMVAAGLAPVLAVYWRHIYGSPLYYTTPLLALLALPAVAEFHCAGSKAKLWMGGLAALLFLVQYPLGTNIVLRSKPWYPCASPTLVSLATKEFSSGPLLRVTLGIGAGGAIPGNDGARFCTGLLFYPLALHVENQQLLTPYVVMKQYLEAHQDDNPPLLVYTSNWTGCAQVNLAMQELGYSCQERIDFQTGGMRAARYMWNRGNRTMIHVDAEDVLAPWDQGGRLAAEMPREHVLYATAGGRERTSVEHGGHVSKVISRTEILSAPAICLFQVDLRTGGGKSPSKPGR